MTQNFKQKILMEISKSNWKESFELVLGNKHQYKIRLNELKTWDKPFVSKSNDTNGKWNEYYLKIEVLEELINE